MTESFAPLVKQQLHTGLCFVACFELCYQYKDPIYRDQFLSQREKRWSMNSQRVEEIVAQLMKPISSDGRRSFDTDLSAVSLRHMPARQYFITFQLDSLVLHAFLTYLI